jgi:hypothetical protein
MTRFNPPVPDHLLDPDYRAIPVVSKTPIECLDHWRHVSQDHALLALALPKLRRMSSKEEEEVREAIRRGKQIQAIQAVANDPTAGERDISPIVACLERFGDQSTAEKRFAELTLKHLAHAERTTKPLSVNKETPE